LNYILSSHVWHQDHNGFSHQDPGFIDHAVNKKAEVIRVYLPPDANTLLSVMEHCLDSRDYVNIVVSGKQPSPTWLGPADAAHHCQRGLGIWQFAGSEVPGEEPDVVLACAGDVPTVETVAAAELLREGAPGLKIRVVNVRLPRVPVTDSPAGLPAHQPGGPARPRLQGRGHYHHAVRHGHAQRD
jgi:xylulose-5-phosphate/fructose-6-phosphate phosphoketolase